MPDLVICLCAGWCHVCTDWRALFGQAALAHPHIRFAWIDIEDEADAMGDYDVETFPTLLIARGGTPLFLGPLEPSLAILNRLLQSSLSPMTAVPESVDLLRRLRARM